MTALAVMVALIPIGRQSVVAGTVFPEADGPGTVYLLASDLALIIAVVLALPALARAVRLRRVPLPH